MKVKDIIVLVRRGKKLAIENFENGECFETSYYKQEEEIPQILLECEVIKMWANNDELIVICK